MNVVFFSYTGTSKKVAEYLASELNCKIVEIKPERSRSYIEWLILSFIPGFRVKISHENIESDEIILCFPKWTFNCPPITSLLKSGKLADKKVFIIVVCGGWQAESYTEKYSKIVEEYGGKVVGWKIIKRKNVDNVPKNKDFLREVKSAFKAVDED